MALRFSLFNIRKPRTFNYTPRLWDPEKEERELRWRRSEEKAGIIHRVDPDKPYQTNIKGQFRKNLESARRTNAGVFNKRLSKIIILVSIAILFLAIFYMAQLFPFLFGGPTSVQ